MTPERQQWLDEQYILSIQNDGGWYHETKYLLEKGRFHLFIQVTGGAIRSLARELGKSLPSYEERAYIYCTLWDHYDADIVAGIVEASAFSDNNLRNAIIDRFNQILPQQKQSQQEEPMNDNQKARGDITASTVSFGDTTTVATTVAFETRHYVYGRDVTSMSEPELISAIRSVEAEIGSLQTVKTKSKKIQAKIAELETMLAQIVAVLDQR